MSVLDGHSLRTEDRNGITSGYGGLIVTTTEPWLVCSCGKYQAEISSGEYRQESVIKRLMTLEHLMEVLRES